jgi:HEAT repeat protein
MRIPMIGPAVFLGSLLCLHGYVRAQDGKKNQPEGADPAAAARQAARDALARFEKPPKGVKAGTRNWKIRMECLVALAKAGSASVPVLLDALKTGSPESRALAGGALSFLADEKARPALEQSVEDKERDVRLYAIRALGRLGRLEAKPKYKQIADKDTSAGVRFEMTFALTRDDKPDPGTIRKTLSRYDLTRMDSARLDKAAPDFALVDTSGKTWHLSDFRGKKSVVLVFLIATT